MRPRSLELARTGSRLYMWRHIWPYEENFSLRFPKNSQPMHSLAQRYRLWIIWFRTVLFCLATLVEKRVFYCLTLHFWNTTNAPYLIGYSDQITPVLTKISAVPRRLPILLIHFSLRRLCVIYAGIPQRLCWVLPALGTSKCSPIKNCSWQWSICRVTFRNSTDGIIRPL